MVGSLAAPAGDDLVAALGAAGYGALRERLFERALAWARDAAGGEPLTAASGAELPALLEGHVGQVFLVGTDVPALGREHLEAARSDLEDGVFVTVAPATDGRPFLVALAEADADLLATACEGFPSLGPVAIDRDRAVGLLRSERRLQTLADARALLADPLAPADLVALLQGARLDGAAGR